MNKNTKLFISCAFITTAVALPSLGFSSWKTKSQSKDFGISSSDKKNTKPVAYIKGQETIKYTTIEKALEVAEQNSANNTIYVIPGTDPIITRECTVATNDTLIFPYDGTTWEDASRDTVRNDNFADGNGDLVKTNRKNLVTLNENAHIINNGTIYIGGVLGTSSSNSRQRPTGHTTGHYVELLMYDGSHITNNGNITNYGYIKSKTRHDVSEEEDNQPFIDNIGPNSNMNLPLVIYDYRGATYALAAYNAKIMPFNVFDFPNSQVKMNFDNLAKLNTTVTLYSSPMRSKIPSSLIRLAEKLLPASLLDGGVQLTELNLLAPSNAIFRVNSGKITMKYTPSENHFLYTTNDLNNQTLFEDYNRTQVILNGDIKFSSTTLNLMNILEINTADYFVPFSYKFDINQLSGTTNISNRVKFLAGSQFNVSKNSILNINRDTYFYIDYIDEVTYATEVTLYPKSVSQAQLIDNGLVNINSNFAGKITSETNNAQLTTSTSANFSVNSSELMTSSSSGLNINYEYITLTGNGYGTISDDPNFENPELNVFSAGKNYFSNINGVWYGEKSLLTPSETRTNKTGSFSLRDLIECFDEKTTLITEQGPKNIKFISSKDKVLCFDHFKGKFVYQDIIVKVNHGYSKAVHIELNFENDIRFGIVNEHGLFCIEDQSYVTINEYNFNIYINKNFAIYKDGKLNKTKLLSAKLEMIETESYAIITYSSFNCVANGLLNIINILDGLYNIYPYDENLKYDEDIVKKYAEKYGLFKYKEVKLLVSEYVFNAFNGPYFKPLILSKKVSLKKLLSYLTLLKKYKSIGHIEIDKINGFN